MQANKQISTVPVITWHILFSRYEIIVVAMGPSAKPSANTDRPCVIVKANLFTEDRLTSSWTENVIQDTQIIRLTSTPTPERQVLIPQLQIVHDSLSMNVPYLP